MKTQHEVNSTIITSTGCPHTDALDLAEAILAEGVTTRETIAHLLHIADLIHLERHGDLSNEGNVGASVDATNAVCELADSLLAGTISNTEAADRLYHVYLEVLREHIDAVARIKSLIQVSQVDQKRLQQAESLLADFGFAPQQDPTGKVFYSRADTRA